VSAKRHFVAAVALLVGLLVVPAGARAERFDPESLDRLLAPVALYPDSLLGNILLASTWPTQIQAAHQWVESHPGRSLQEVADAVEGSAWDPSVQMLVLVPDVLAMMAQDMGWTAALGQAFSNQTSDLYDSIQRLRKRARATGSLVNTQTVRVVTDEDGLISIGSVNPNVLLVPRYTPAVVYGWDPGSVVLRTALVWGTVYLLDRAFYGTCWDWHRRRFWWGPGYGTCGYWNGSFRPFGPGSRFEPMRPHLMHRPPSWHVGMGSPAGVRPHGVPSRPPRAPSAHASVGGAPGFDAAHASFGGAPGLYAAHASFGGAPGLYAAHATFGGAPGFDAAHATFGGAPGLYAAHASVWGAPGLFAPFAPLG